MRARLSLLANHVVSSFSTWMMIRTCRGTYNMNSSFIPLVYTNIPRNSPFFHIHQNQTTSFPTLPHIHQPSCCGRLDLKVPLASKTSWNNWLRAELTSSHSTVCPGKATTTTTTTTKKHWLFMVGWNLHKLSVWNLKHEDLSFLDTGPYPMKLKGFTPLNRLRASGSRLVFQSKIWIQ